ncbi:MAG: tetratricopeptide repeat protein [Cardiobacteriaceae bacterium]|nr:tetratricopeptide repeat protein [Cardiobacteriaceae bacterium]
MKINKISLLTTFVAAVMLSGCSSFGFGDKGADDDLPNVVTKKKADYNKAYQDYVELGAQYLQMGRYDLAEPKLKRAIEIDSHPPEAWNILAVLYEETRDIASGNQIYQKLIHSHPEYVLGYVNYATFLCKFDRDSELQALYGQMRGRNAEFKTASYIAEGNCMQRRNQLGQAESAYKQALTSDSQASGALLPLAEISLQKGDYAAALRYLKVVHTYVGYSPESVKIGIEAARKSGDSRMEEELVRVMRANYKNTSQAQSLGI